MLNKYMKIHPSKFSDFYPFCNIGRYLKITLIISNPGIFFHQIQMEFHIFNFICIPSINKQVIQSSQGQIKPLFGDFEKRKEK